MFEGLRSLAGLGPMLAALPKMRAAAEEAKRRVEAIRVEGTSRCGSARAVVSGGMRVEAIAPPAGDAASAAEAIREAVNDGLAKAQLAAAEEMQAALAESGVPLPPGVLPGR